VSKHRKKSDRTLKPATTAGTKPAAHPWVINGIDYGPTIAVADDLAAWAFDLAARDVADWPEGQRRVRTARRFVLRWLHGKHQRLAPFEDLLFTAGLLARNFDEIGLAMSEVVGILDNLGLPTEVVPLRPREQPSMRLPICPPVVPPHPQPADLSALFRTAVLAEMFAGVDIDDPAPCDECSCPRLRNAAVPLPIRPSVVPHHPQPAGASVAATAAALAKLFTGVDNDAPAPCDECGYFPRLRNAA